MYADGWEIVVDLTLLLTCSWNFPPLAIVFQVLGSQAAAVLFINRSLGLNLPIMYYECAFGMANESLPWRVPRIAELPWKSLTGTDLRNWHQVNGHWPIWLDSTLVDFEPSRAFSRPGNEFAYLPEISVGALFMGPHWFVDSVDSFEPSQGVPMGETVVKYSNYSLLCFFVERIYLRVWEKFLIDMAFDSVLISSRSWARLCLHVIIGLSNLVVKVGPVILWIFK